MFNIRFEALWNDEDVHIEVHGVSSRVKKLLLYTSLSKRLLPSSGWLIQSQTHLLVVNRSFKDPAHSITYQKLSVHIELPATWLPTHTKMKACILLTAWKFWKVQETALNDLLGTSRCVCVSVGFIESLAYCNNKSFVTSDPWTLCYFMFVHAIK